MKGKLLQYYLLVIAVGMGYSCDSDLIDDQVRIRIKNVSSFEYTNVNVNTSGGENFYGDISPNSFSDYKVFDFAYRYAFIELKVGEDKFTLQPIDYFGEEVLSSGKYTYEIGANSTGGQYDRLSLILVED